VQAPQSPKKGAQAANGSDPAREAPINTQDMSKVRQTSRKK
jgi:hypothetical protein